MRAVGLSMDGPDGLSEKSKDLMRDVRKLGTEFENAGLILLQTFIPNLQDAVKETDGFAQIMNVWLSHQDKWTQGLLGLAGAYGAVRTALGAVRMLLPGGSALPNLPGVVGRAATGALGTATGLGAFLWGMRPSPTNTGEDEHMRSDPAMFPNAPGGPGQRAFRFFKQAGWSDAAAAGLAANILRESNGNVSATGDGGAAYGLAQWHKDRQQAFRLWAGKDIRDSSVTFEDQLAFMNYELRQGREKSAGDALAGANTPGDAGAIVSSKYLRPGDAAGEAALRASLATRLYGGALGTGAVPANDTGAGGVVLNQETNINVHGGSASAAEIGSMTASEQRRVNGDLVRNLKGAVK
jgi:hypothetical protein